MKYIGKGSVWEELPRSAETSSVIQKKSIPRKKPTYQRATTLSRLPKLAVWEKCWEQIIESKWHIPAIWVARKNKHHINCERQGPGVWLNSCFLPGVYCLPSSPATEASVPKASLPYKEVFVRTGCWHSKQTHTQDKVILSENSDTFCFPIINLPALKALPTFRHKVFDANAT